MAFGVRCKTCGYYEAEHNLPRGQGCATDADPCCYEWNPECELTEEEREELKADSVAVTH